MNIALVGSKPVPFDSPRSGESGDVLYIPGGQLEVLVEACWGGPYICPPLICLTRQVSFVEVVK